MPDRHWVVLNRHADSYAEALQELRALHKQYNPGENPSPVFMTGSATKQLVAYEVEGLSEEWLQEPTRLWSKMPVHIDHWASAGGGAKLTEFKQGWNNTFDIYVDPENGSDEGAGTYDDPIQSFSEIWKRNGTSIGIKRGTETDERLLINKSGTPQKDLFIGAYGEGDNPLIVGGKELSGTWVNEGNRVWSIKLDGTFDTQTYRDHLWFGRTRVGDEKDRTSDLQNKFDYYINNNNKIFLYSEGNPESYYNHMKMFVPKHDSLIYSKGHDYLHVENISTFLSAGNNVAISDSSNSTFAHIESWGGSISGIYLAGTGAHHTLVSSIYSHDNGLKGPDVEGDGPIRRGKGVVYTHGAHHNVVENWYTHDNGEHGAHINTLSGNFNTYRFGYSKAEGESNVALKDGWGHVIEHVWGVESRLTAINGHVDAAGPSIIRNNVLIDAGAETSTRVGWAIGLSATPGWTVTDNWIINPKQGGILTYDAGNHVISDNHIFKDSGNGGPRVPAILIGKGATNVDLERNVVTNEVGPALQVVEPDTLTQRDNEWWAPENEVIFRYLYSDYENNPKEVAAFFQRLGGAKGSIVHEPAFADPVNGDLSVPGDKEPPPPDGPTVIGAVQEVTGLTDQTLKVAFGDGVDLNNPVVFATPATISGADPVTTEFNNIDGRSASFYLDEPDYLNGVHPAQETATLLALEEGVWDLGGGRRLEVGTTSLNVVARDGFVDVAFSRAYDAAPTVIVQVQSNSGAQWETARVKDVNANGFKLALQEEQGNSSGGHATEVVGWAALPKGPFDWNGLDVEAFKTGARVTDQPTDVAFDSSVGAAPLVAASLVSFHGSDPANLRLADVSGGTARFVAHEEQSGDDETGHVGEEVAGLAFSGEGLLTGSDFYLL